MGGEQAKRRRIVTRGRHIWVQRAKRAEYVHRKRHTAKSPSRHVHVNLVYMESKNGRALKGYN